MSEALEISVIHSVAGESIEGSAAVASRIAAARDAQRRRYEKIEHGPRTNAEADGKLLEEIAAPDADGRKLLTEAAEPMRLTARGYHRVLRVARTLADLDASAGVRRIHIAEALAWRRAAHGGFVVRKGLCMGFWA